jgi:hypothetical protein
VDQATSQRTMGAAYSTLQADGQSPYFLVYDSEAILPADVMWDSPAVEQYDEGISEDSRRVDIADSKKLAALPSSNQQGTLRVSDATTTATSRNAPSTLATSSSAISRTRKDCTSSAHHGKVPSHLRRWPDQAPTASRHSKAKTSETCGTSTSSVGSTRNLTTTLGAQVYTTTSRPLRCKRPPGPGTSLRTTLLQRSSVNGYQRVLGCSEHQRTLAAVYQETMYF